MDELRSILSTLNSHQTSICKGIPEEKLITWANRKNISQILIERFSSKVVFRDRNCSYVMLETDQADICRSCAMLLSTSSLDMMEEQELECPFPDCDRAFKYQGALDKHIMKHNQVSQSVSQCITLGRFLLLMNFAAGRGWRGRGEETETRRRYSQSYKT